MKVSGRPNRTGPEGLSRQRGPSHGAGFLPLKARLGESPKERGAHADWQSTYQREVGGR